MKVLPVILCGGSGTRLWPLSREQFPKQLLALEGTETLLQATVRRLERAAPEVDIQPSPVIVCNREHRFMVAEQLRDAGVKARPIIPEPAARGTAPALTLAALHVVSEEDMVLLVMPADHVVREPEPFHDAVARGVALAASGHLVTFGVPPVLAETGYGYIRLGEEIEPGLRPTAHRVAAFAEKPDLPTARRYVASREYLWNSGIFVLRASLWLDVLGRIRPDILLACEHAYRAGGWRGDAYAVDEEAFAACPEDSIDYAVMEHVGPGGGASCQSAVVTLDAGWSDVGAWDALWQIGRKDYDGNVVHGDVCAVDTQDALLYSQHRLLACVGLSGVVVVETPDAVLVARRDKAQQVKDVVARLKRETRRECIAHRKVYRPWGNYESIDVGERFQVKRLTVHPGAALSLQKHYHRAEHWCVVRGTARVTRGDEEILLTENQSIYIPVGVKHRLENPGRLPLHVIEVQSGPYLGEDDLVRYEDVYGRADKALSVAEAKPALALAAAQAGEPAPRAAGADPAQARRA